LLIAGLVCFAGIALVSFFVPHYAAPAVGIILAVILEGMRHLRTLGWNGKREGLFLVRAVTLICFLMVPIHIFLLTTHARSEPAPSAGEQRAKLLAELCAIPGHHLVLVRYGPDHPLLSAEWVYNDAEIDNSKVVWARDMGAYRNQELIRYFKDRQVWLLHADETPPILKTYSKAGPIPSGSAGQ
jgi:hypothetical protein